MSYEVGNDFLGCIKLIIFVKHQAVTAKYTKTIADEVSFLMATALLRVDSHYDVAHVCER